MGNLLVLWILFWGSMFVSIASSAGSSEDATDENQRDAVKSEDLHALEHETMERTILLSEDLAVENGCKNSFGFVSERRANGIGIKKKVKLRGNLCLYDKQLELRIGRIKRPKFPTKVRGGAKKGTKPFKYEIGMKVKKSSSCGVVGSFDFDFVGNPIEALGLGCTIRFTGLSKW